MKILVLSSHTKSLFWFRLDMMKNFLALGYQVVAVGSEDSDHWKSNFDAYNIKYLSIPVSRNGLNPLTDLKTLVALKKIIKEEKPDKIFAYQAKTIIYGSIVARKQKITEFYSLVAGLGSVFRGSGFKNKIIRYLLSSEYKIACHNSKSVIFQNNDDREVFINNKIVSSEKTKIINGSGVNIDKFVFSDLPNEVSFLFIGRLIKDKGIFEYLDACELIKKEFPNIKCMLVGPFDTNPSAICENDLKHYIDNGIIKYFGEQNDVRPYIKMASIFVLPSYHEGTPKTVLEAMAMGRAIITSNSPGCRETVENGKNGLLVNVKDTFDLYSKMKYLIENPEQIRMMGKEARILAENKYDVKIINKNINEIMNLERKK